MSYEHVAYCYRDDSNRDDFECMIKSCIQYGEDIQINFNNNNIFYITYDSQNGYKAGSVIFGAKIEYIEWHNMSFYDMYIRALKIVDAIAFCIGTNPVPNEHEEAEEDTKWEPIDNKEEEKDENCFKKTLGDLLKEKLSKEIPIRD